MVLVRETFAATGIKARKPAVVSFETLRTPVTPVGAPGTVSGVGVTAPDGSEAGPVPPGPVAVTVKVYGVPAVRPVTVQLVAPDRDTVVQVKPPGDEVTVGAVHATVTEPLPAVPWTPVGLPGGTAAMFLVAVLLAVPVLPSKSVPDTCAVIVSRSVRVVASNVVDQVSVVTVTPLLVSV
jgi:hypothetical protein